MNKGSGNKGKLWLRYRLGTMLTGLVLSGFLVACGQAQLAASELQPELPNAGEGAVRELKLNSSHAQERGFFGDSLAMSGDTLVVGAWGEDTNGDESGAAYVFVRGTSGWELQAELRASDAGAEHRFGHAVTVDGDTIVIGAIYHDQHGYHSGAVYLFERQGGTWTERAILTPRDAAAYQHFGSSVVLDGDTLVVGAGGFAAQAAYVFERSGTHWNETAKLQAPVTTENERFGSAVALSDNMIAVGAWSEAVTDEADAEDDESAFASHTVQSGTVHIFSKDNSGWSRSAVLTSGADLRLGFGWSLALHDDTLVVGAPELNDTSMAGAAYIFRHDNGAWTLQATLSPATGHDFGWSVAVDGTTILVGAPSDDDNLGAGFMFHQENNGWQLARKVRASDASGALHFGGAVAVSAKNMVFGATGDQSGGVASGAAYVFY